MSNFNLGEYYREMKIQPIEIIRENMTRDEYLGYLKGCIIKYVCRMGHKDSEYNEAFKLMRYATYLDDYLYEEAQRKSALIIAKAQQEKLLKLNNSDEECCQNLTVEEEN